MESVEKIDQTTDELVKLCVQICEERKAQDIVVFDVREKSVLTDYYIVCSGTSQPHIAAIGSHIQRAMQEKGIAPRGHDGEPESRWMILDYANIVVHILEPEMRQYYCLEELWDDRKIVYPAKKDDEE